MEEIFTRFSLMVGRALFLLLFLCFVHLTVRACDHRDGPIISCYVVVVSGPYTLSVKLTNLIEVGGREQDRVDVFARVQISDEHGRVIAQSEEVKVPAKSSNFVKFESAKLSLRGQSGTVRKLLVIAEWRAAEPFQLHRDSRKQLPVSMQLIDEITGVKTDLAATPYHDDPKMPRGAREWVYGVELPGKVSRDKRATTQGDVPNRSGNQAAADRITSVLVDPGDSSEPANKKAKVAQPDLIIRQFLFPPTNDKGLRVHVFNTGQAASGACRLFLTLRKINGVAAGRQTHVNVPALAAGADVWLVIDAKSILPNNVKLESTTFKLNVDATEIVAESDESNNEVWHNL